MFYVMIDGESDGETQDAPLTVALQAPESEICASCGMDEWEHHEDERAGEAHDCDYVPSVANLLNSAYIDVGSHFGPDDGTLENGKVSVGISIGDPRGAFQMSIEHRTITNDEGEDEEATFLSVPHPTDGMPHTGLETIRPGWYRVRPYSAELYDAEVARERERESVTEEHAPRIYEVLCKLLEWATVMGGWEAEVWESARDAANQYHDAVVNA